MVVGTVNCKQAPILRRIYEQMAEPKWVIAFGVCASSGGFYDNYATVQGIDRIVPVDVYIPGCPPRPEQVLDGIMLLQKKIQEQPHKLIDRAPLPVLGQEPASGERGTMSKAVIDALVERFPDAVYDAYAGVGGDDCAFVKKDRIAEVCRFLKDDPALRFNMAPYITAVDYLGAGAALRGRLQPALDGDERADPAAREGAGGATGGAERSPRCGAAPTGSSATASTCTASASAGHPDLRRLLMYDEFVGHPLRKDYPLRGRQPLVPEREVQDIYRGPGPATRD